jgi:prepilin-type N-terminal cleavage/methylation domain-containing protein
MYKQIKSNNQGFTIIEVMIVLAIAALILIIVLLAVPALQRNSKNTTLKNDASSVAGAISDYESNNNGGAPGFACGGSGNAGAVTIATTGTCTSGVPSMTTGTVATTQVATNTSVITSTSASTVSTTSPPSANTVYVFPGFICGTGTQPSPPTMQTGAVAVYYGANTSGATWAWSGCIQS